MDDEDEEEGIPNLTTIKAKKPTKPSAAAAALVTPARVPGGATPPRGGQPALGCDFPLATARPLNKIAVSTQLFLVQVRALRRLCGAPRLGLLPGALPLSAPGRGGGGGRPAHVFPPFLPPHRDGGHLKRVLRVPRARPPTRSMAQGAGGHGAFAAAIASLGTARCRCPSSHARSPVRV